VWTACGFCYVSFITDVYSRRILGWRSSMSKTSDLVSAALAQALATRRRASSEFTARGLIHHPHRRSGHPGRTRSLSASSAPCAANASTTS
jgi:putative transposase